MPNNNNTLETKILSYANIVASGKQNNMVLSTNVITENTNYKMNKLNIGELMRSALISAQMENRLIIGLSEMAKYLSETPDDAFICFMAPPKLGDSATHMHEVLLEAYCYENDIYIIKIDNSEKLSRLLSSSSLESCALIQKKHIQQLSSAENALVDYCEEYWDAPQQPIIQLPDS